MFEAKPLEEDSYIAIDPGGKANGHTVGIACFTLNGDLSWLCQMSLNSFTDWVFELDWDKVTTVICEEYRQLPFKKSATYFNRMLVVQCVGIIKSWCSRKGVHLVMQQAAILPIAEKHFQLSLPKNHADSHKFSAYLHGAEYLLKQGVKQSVLRQEFENAQTEENERTESN